MHYIKINTMHNTIELIVDDYFSQEVQQIINQPYVREIYLRCIDYEDINNYKNIKRLVRKKK